MLASFLLARSMQLQHLQLKAIARQHLCTTQGYDKFSGKGSVQDLRHMPLVLLSMLHPLVRANEDITLVRDQCADTD